MEEGGRTEWGMGERQRAGRGEEVGGEPAKIAGPEAAGAGGGGEPRSAHTGRWCRSCPGARSEVEPGPGEVLRERPGSDPNVDGSVTVCFPR